MFVKNNGKKHYLWRAVDHEGEVLEAFATRTRDKAAALKFLKKKAESVTLSETEDEAVDVHGRADYCHPARVRGGIEAFP